MIDLLETLRKMMVAQLSPRMGHQHHSPGQSLATNDAKRRPGICKTNNRCPEGASRNEVRVHVWLVSAPSGQLTGFCGLPRAALSSALGYDVKARWAKIDVDRASFFNDKVYFVLRSQSFSFFPFLISMRSSEASLYLAGNTSSIKS